MDREDENEGFPGAVADGIPVFADTGELEAGCGAGVGGGGDGDALVFRREGGFGDALDVR